MGRTISIYLDDELIDILKRQDKSVSGAVKDALCVYLKSAEIEKGFDQVIKSAEKIGMSKSSKEAEREWIKDREIDCRFKCTAEESEKHYYLTINASPLYTVSNTIGPMPKKNDETLDEYADYCASMVNFVNLCPGLPEKE